MTPDFLVLGVIWYIVFLFSTTCHEGAHALAAKLGGDTTAFEGGQVSLNPIPHIRRSPVGLVLVPIISYFVAHWMIAWAIAPSDPLWQSGPHQRMDGLGRASRELHARHPFGVAIQRYDCWRLRNDCFCRLHSRGRHGGGNAASATFSASYLFNLLGTFNLRPCHRRWQYRCDAHHARRHRPPIPRLVSHQPADRLNFAWYVFDRIFGVVLVALDALYPGSHWG
jgi:hypothetical protein